MKLKQATPYLILFAICLIQFALPAFGQQSDAYKIEGGQVSVDSPEDAPTTPTIQAIYGQLAAIEFSHAGVAVYPAANEALDQVLKAAIGKANFIFADIAPKKPKRLETLIAVSGVPETRGQIRIGADGPLENITGSIKPTVCDDQSRPCTARKAKPWSRSDAFGFGYGAQGPQVARDILSPDYFRPFANLSIGEESALLAQGRFGKTKLEAELALKLNISDDQPQGTYNTTIRIQVAGGF